MRAPATATRIGRGRLSRLALASAVVAVVAGIGAGVASAYWLATDSSAPAVALADRVLTGPRPSLVGIDGQDVTVSWPASTTAAGQPVLGYTVSRYASATGGTATAAGSGCAATVATLSCTDADVAAGLWYYAVTPRIYNWAGPESARSPAVVVVAPSLSLTAGQVVPNLPGTVTGGSIAHFKANEAVALRLDTATGTVLSATITTVDGAGQASGFTITIPATTSDGAHVVVALGSGGSRATSNSFTVDTAAPTVVIDRVSKALLGPAATSMLVWHAEESGAYSVRVGGTDCSTGTEVAAASYTAAGQVTTSVTAGSLVEGPNTLRVCVVDASSHVGSATTTISLDTTSPTGGSVTYRDGYYGSLLVAVTLLNGTDAVGGIAPSGHVLERAATTLANGSCVSPFGAFSVVATDPPVSPSVYTDTAVASGNCYQYRYVVVDNASNTVTYATSAAVRVDTSAPTFASPALTLTAGPNSFVSGTNVFYNPNLTSGFAVAAPGVTDPQSGVAKVNFPLIGGGVNGGGDQTAAPYTAAYTAAAGASASGSRSVTATNNALVTATAAFTLIPDGLVPAGGALAVNNGGATSGGSSSYSTSGTFSMGRTDFTDAGAGLSSSTLTRAAGTLVANSCSSFTSPTILVGNPSQSLATGCYRYVLTGTDYVGNVATVSTVVMVDTTMPATPKLAFTGLANAFYDTAITTLYVRPAAGGAFTVTAASSDAETGVRAGTEGYTFSPLNTNGGANFSNSQTAGANAYTFDAATTAPSSPATVSATSNAGVASAPASYSVVADTAAPTAPTPTVVAAYYTTASVPVSVAAATDTGSGVAAVILQRDQAALSGAACGSFPDTFATSIVLSGGNDTTVASGFCYQYRLRVTDRVGNQATSGPSAIAKVETSAPSSPTLTFSSMTNAGASGTTVYARSAQNSGGFTVTAGSVDPETGVSFAFPTFPAGWTVVGSGGSRTYSWANNATMPSGSQTVTVTNGAGLVATTSFTVVADNTGPTVSDVALANGTSGTAGTIGPGDSATVTFSEQMEASRFCPSWTNAGVQTLGDVVITVVNRGGHDELSIVSPSCPGLNITTAAASVNTNANYVRVGETVTFAGTVSWNPVTNTIRITVGGLTSGALSVQTGVGPKVAKYGPPANLTDVAGNGLPTSMFTSAAPTGF